MVGDPFCPRTRGGAEWTIRSLHDQPLVSLKYLVPRLPRLAVEQDEVIAHGNRRLPPPCDGTVKQHLDGPGKFPVRPWRKCSVRLKAALVGRGRHGDFTASDRINEVCYVAQDGQHLDALTRTGIRPTGVGYEVSDR